MSGELDQIHPQKPAEGAVEDVEAPGAEHARDDLREPGEDTEGGEDEIDALGADRPGNAG